MTTRRHNKRKVRKSQKGGARKRQSNAGTMLPPLDVRTPTALKELEKRIKAGPLTIVLVYADWCGHCHEMRPHFDAASKSPNRTVQSVSVNETMLDQVNNTIKHMNQSAQPLEADAYPTIMVVDNQGNKVSDVEPEKNTAMLTKVMTTPTGPPTAEEAEEGAAEATKALNTQEPASIGRMKVKDPSKLQAPPPVAQDMVGGSHRGGTLLSALSQSAYTLAPAAVLLATAAAVMSKRNTRKARKGRKASKRSNGSKSRKMMRR